MSICSRKLLPKLLKTTIWNMSNGSYFCIVTRYMISTIAESEDSQESVDSVTDSQKRREILSRRPSYRKILNDLSSDAPGVPRIEEEKSEEETSAPAITTVTVPTPIYQTSSGQYSE
uniref:KID domain-containing protein n=1 Tax=Catagonus wagneri TaxID=51154 RepID=A0A8C3X913_9CETA